MQTAVIFGCTGQDGSYLSELLLEKGYHVIGVSRRVSVPTDERIRHLAGNAGFELIQGDVTDAACVNRIIARALAHTSDWPLEIYNLSAQSHVGTSFEQPSLTTDVTYKGCLNILECLYNEGLANGDARFYQASSSEMFGSAYSLRWTEHGLRHYDHRNAPLEGLFAQSAFQDETTPFAPNSPYAIAKLAAHHLVRVYRESYGLHASSGILFNHESPRRGETFVTRKITKHLAKVLRSRCHGLPVPKLKLGNLDAKRDWGHAEDYVRGMWLMLQQPTPDDYVLATGKANSVRDFLVAAYKVVGIDLTTNFEDYVEIDPCLYRPCEVPFLRGDASKARRVLGWEPTVSFEELVKRMVLADTTEVTRGLGY